LWYATAGSASASSRTSATAPAAAATAPRVGSCAGFFVASAASDARSWAMGARRAGAVAATCANAKNAADVAA
jgi:hypothetical protein